MDPLENLVSTAEPAFACDSKGRIVAWNESVEGLLGRAASDAVGKLCFEVLDGRDLFGNRFCDQRCAIMNMVRRHEPIHHCRLSCRTASSERIDVSVSAFVLAGQATSDYFIVHLLEPIAEPGDEPGLDNPSKPKPSFLPDDPMAARVSCVELTPRQTEVLRMLASGLATAQIACRLTISEATVRNHVRNILNKLDVHSRLEAVCLAIRRRLF